MPAWKRGKRHEAGYVLRQGHITFVLTSPLSREHPESQRLIQHGDGVMDIALEVEDVRRLLQGSRSPRRRGRCASRTLLEDEYGVFECATIRTYGDTTHSFVNRDRYKGVFAPGFKPLDPERYDPLTFHPVGLKAIDHIVGNVEEGKMDEWVHFYENVLGFKQLVHFDDKDISTEYSALMSKVVQNGTGRIKFPLNEPAKSRRKSQIEEFLQFYSGPGVQHIAMATDDIVAHRAGHAAQRCLVPAGAAHVLRYAARTRRARSREDLKELAELGILVDRDDEGYMLQIFTKPVADRPTLFFEVIQRRGSRSFGKGNFKALFEAIEREQEKARNAMIV